LSEARVERAIALSAEKYCSASMMLEAGGVAVSHSHELREVQ
jgi:putative redox protein